MSVPTLVARHEVERGSDAKSGVVFTFEDDRGVRTRFVSRVGLTYLREKEVGSLPGRDMPLLDLFDAHCDFILTVASLLVPNGAGAFEIEPSALADALQTREDSVEGSKSTEPE